MKRAAWLGVACLLWSATVHADRADKEATTQDALADRDDVAATQVAADGDTVAQDDTADPEPPANPTADVPTTDVGDRSATLTATDSLNVGDAFTAEITVQVPKGDDVGIPQQPFDPFEMLDKDVAVQEAADGTQTHRFSVELIGFDPGSFSLGPLEVRVTTQNGDLLTLKTNDIEVQVASRIGNEPAPTLRPETEPVTVMQDDYTLAWVLGVLAAMLLGGVLTWLFSRWWRNRDVAPPAPPPPPPWETALKELRQVERTRLPMLGENNLTGWVDSVSDVVRKYLGARFGFDGLESTTDEIVRHLRSTELRGIAPEDALTFLAECDLVKFAKAPMAESATETLLQSAYAMVDRTKGARSAETPAAPDPDLSVVSDDNHGGAGGPPIGGAS